MNSKLSGGMGTELLEATAAATDDAPTASAPAGAADFGFPFTDRRSDGFVRRRFISPRASDKVARVRALADKDLRGAKALYEELFGVKHNDESIDFAVSSALSQYTATGDLSCPPPEVFLAVWLRRGGRPVGRIPSSKDLTGLMERALRRKRETMDEYPRGHPNHVKAPDAEKMVAAEFLAESGLRTPERFIHVMKHRNLWNPETRKRPDKVSADKDAVEKQSAPTDVARHQMSPTWSNDCDQTSPKRG